MLTDAMNGTTGNIVPASAVYRILKKLEGTKDYETVEKVFLSQIPQEDRKLLDEIKKGKKLPLITSDVVFKRIFDPIQHKERLEYLLRGISGIRTLDVSKTIGNEGYRESIFGKNVIFDLPAGSTDGMLVNTEMQVAAQKYILKRGEIISSNLMMLQYSAAEGTAKGNVEFDNVAGTLLSVLMRQTPKGFISKRNQHYIHVFDRSISNTGIIYKTLQTIVYVELGKCLSQYKNGVNGEEDDNLQSFLAMIADVNNRKVQDNIRNIFDGETIMDELRCLAMDKEVGIMMLAERYAAADLNAVRAYEREEGIEIGEARGELNKSLVVYQNCRDRGMSIEDAIAISSFPKDYDTSTLK